MKASLNLASAVKAGILGTVLMTILMYGLPLVGLPVMDIMAALGAVFPFQISPYIPGFIVHFGIGIVLALIYAAFFYSWLPGPSWSRGALFSLLPWLFAITLLGPSLQLASRAFGTAQSRPVANPCAPANPCVPKAAANPCSPKASNPCALVNPCAVKAPSNPCAPQATNPCAPVAANPCVTATINPCAPGKPSAPKTAANPCTAKAANPCAPAAANPCAAGGSSQGLPPQALSLIAHLIYGAVVGFVYRPRS